MIFRCGGSSQSQISWTMFMNHEPDMFLDYCEDHRHDDVTSWDHVSPLFATSATCRRRRLAESPRLELADGDGGLPKIRHGIPTASPPDLQLFAGFLIFLSESTTVTRDRKVPPCFCQSLSNLSRSWNDVEATLLGSTLLLHMSLVDGRCSPHDTPRDIKSPSPSLVSEA